jgi:hypothetical protein
LILGALMFVAFAVAQMGENLRLVKSLQLVLLAVVLVASLVFAERFLLAEAGNIALGLANLDPGAVLVVFVTVWMWWRGITLARVTIRPMTAWRRFEFGLLLFMAHIFVTSQLNEPRPGLGWFAAFLFFGFLAVIFARVSYVGITKGVNKNPFDRRWLAGTLATLFSAIAVAAVLGSLLTGQYQLVLEMLAEAFRLLVAVGLFIAAIPALILSNFLGPVVSWLQRLLPTPAPDPNAQLMPAYPNPQVGMLAEPLPLPLVLQSLCFWVMMVVIVAVIFLRVRRALSRRGRDDLDEPESLLKRGDAGKLLRKALQDAMDGLAARLRPAQRLLAAVRIRRIYTQLLDLCDELNSPRPPEKTPLEFLPAMGELFTALSAELELITQAYVRVRYGEYPETREEVEDVEQAWQHIAEEGRRLKRAGVGKLQTAEIKDVQRTGV